MPDACILKQKIKNMFRRVVISENMFNHSEASYRENMFKKIPNKGPHMSIPWFKKKGGTRCLPYNIMISPNGQHLHRTLKIWPPSASSSNAQHQLPTPSQLANHPHISQSTPLITTLETHLSIYFHHFQQAVDNDDTQQIVNSVINILCLPSAILCRHSKGRGKHRINNERLCEAIISAINDASIIDFIQIIQLYLDRSRRNNDVL
jgi:hypothetical protein